MNESKELSTVQKFTIIGGGIALFIIITIGFFYVFKKAEVDLSVSTIMSVISGVLVVWIILSVSGILKEFSIKGGIFEMSAKIKEEIDSVKKEVSETRIDMIEKFADIKLSVSTIQSANSQSRIELEQHFHRDEAEIDETLEHSSIPEKRIDPELKISEPNLEKIDQLMSQVKSLSKLIDKKIEFNIKSSMRRANALFYNQKFKEALDIYEKILNEAPNNTDALFNKAYCLGQLRQFNESIKTYERLLTIDKPSPTVYHNIGWGYDQLGKIDNAGEMYEKALSLDKNHFYSIRSKGYIFLAYDKNFPEAEKWYKKALEINKTDANTLYNLACIKALEKNKKESLDYLKKAIDNNQTYKELAKEDIDLQILLGDPEFLKLVS